MKKWASEDMELLADEVVGNVLPVDLDSLAEGYGAVIYKEKLDNDVSGMLLTSGDKKIILINKIHHENRQRFTTAHEIAHIILHGDAPDDVFIDSRGSATMYFRSPESMSTLPLAERKANELASYLLMPRKAVNTYISANPIDLNDDVAMKILSNKFKVSIQAISIRLTRLGLLH